MATIRNLGEVITAMITPFDNDGNIDYDAAIKLSNYLADNGSDAILVAGTTGESPTLTHEEEHKLATEIKKSIGSKTQVILGAGSNCTKTAIQASKDAEKTGVDGILSVVPYYNKPSQSGLINHFSQIAEACNLPIILYNIPGRTGIDMAPDTVAELDSKYDNIIAVKQSNSDLDLISELVEKTSDEFMIYSGDDSLTLPMLSLGCQGVVSVASHLVGSQIKEMIQAFKAGEVKKAQEIHHKHYNLFKKLFLAPNPVPVKSALAHKNIIPNANVRSPLVSLTQTELNTLLAITDKF